MLSPTTQRRLGRSRWWRSAVWSTVVLTIVSMVTVGWLLATPIERDPRPDWSGRWDTRWRDGAAVVEFEQLGEVVRGTYGKGIYNGRVIGRVTGRILEGRWIQDDAEGRFLFSMSPEGDSFAGRFDTGEWWNGGRVSDGDSPRIAVDLTSPRSTIRTFLTSFNAVQAGAPEHATNGVRCLDFGPNPPERVVERTRLAQLLFDLIDRCTVHIYLLPDGADESEIQIDLRQAGTGEVVSLTIARNRVGDWHIRVPDEEKMRQQLSVLLAARNQKRLDRGSFTDLQNPRATFQSFFTNLQRWDGAGREHVMATLDLSALPQPVRDRDIRLLADYLKEAIDRIGFAVWQEIPDDPVTQTPYVHYRHPSGDIVVAPMSGPDGTVRWQFTSETLRDLRELYTAIEALPKAAGVASHQGELYFRIREWARSISPGLLAPFVLLENWQWLGILVLGLLSFVAAVASTLLFNVIARLLLWNSDLWQRLIQRMALPLRASVVAGMWHELAPALGLPQYLLAPILAIALTVFVVAVVWQLLCITGMVSQAWHERTEQTKSPFDEILVSILAGLTKIMIVVAGIFVLAEGLNLPYQSVIAGLGIGGLAFAIASRDSLANLFGSAVLLLDRPFRKGDFVGIDGTFGTIERVGLRSTSFRTLADSVVTIPNNDVANTKIDNLGQRRYRLVRTTLSVTYDTPPDLLERFCDGLRELVRSHPDTRDENIIAGTYEFGASSLDIEMVFHVYAPSWADERHRRHHIIVEIIRLADSLGVKFAFPTRTIHLATGPDTGDLHPEAAATASKPM
jgi:MscS family membrane protein